MQIDLGKTRSSRRERCGAINVYAAETVLGWRIIDQVGADIAAQQVGLRRWREVFYEDGTLAGVQPLKPAERMALGDVLIGRLMAVTITLPELKRNAGLYGRSHTIGMPEWRRLCRHARYDEKKILPPEDLNELAIEKVRLWPYPASRIGTQEDGSPVFGDKAIRVYPPIPRRPTSC